MPHESEKVEKTPWHLFPFECQGTIIIIINTLLVIFIITNKKLRRINSNIFLMNLFASHVMEGVVAFLRATIFFSQDKNSKVISYAVHMFTSTTILSFLCNIPVTIERLVAIRWPFSYTWLTNIKAVLINQVPWLVAALYCLSAFLLDLNSEVGDIITIVLTICMYVALTWANFSIYKVVRKQTNAIKQTCVELGMSNPVAIQDSPTLTTTKRLSTMSPLDSTVMFSVSSRVTADQDSRNLKEPPVMLRSKRKVVPLPCCEGKEDKEKELEENCENNPHTQDTILSSEIETNAEINTSISRKVISQDPLSETSVTPLRVSNGKTLTTDNQNNSSQANIKARNTLNITTSILHDTDDLEIHSSEQADKTLFDPTNKVDIHTNNHNNLIHHRSEELDQRPLTDKLQDGNDPVNANKLVQLHTDLNHEIVAIANYDTPNKQCKTMSYYANEAELSHDIQVIVKLPTENTIGENKLNEGSFSQKKRNKTSREHLIDCEKCNARISLPSEIQPLHFEPEVTNHAQCKDNSLVQQNISDGLENTREYHHGDERKYRRNIFCRFNHPKVSPPSPRHHTANDECELKKKANRLKKKKQLLIEARCLRSAYICISIVCSFFCFWTPHALHDFFKVTKLAPSIVYSDSSLARATLIIAFCNAIIDPLIYIFLNKDLKTELKRVLRYCRKNNSRMK